MRADRLLSLLLLLQSKGRLRAADLALRLEVSERTVYRDVEALSAAGVPIVARSGPHGGVALLDGWRTQLTGLTGAEVQALAAVGVPERLRDIGLAESLSTGLLKVAAGLPALQQHAAEQARQRLHIDATAWFEEPEAVPHLAALREAVWQDRKVRLSYRDFDGKVSRPVVAPYALVIKLDRWYLVAGTARGPAVFRGARVEQARILDQGFERPPHFDLAGFWRDWCRRFGERRASYPVTLRFTAAGEAALCRERPPADHQRLASAPRARGGWRLATLDFERATIALAQLVTIGPGVEVVEPPELRQRLARIGEELQALYGPPAPPEGSPQG